MCVCVCIVVSLSVCAGFFVRFMGLFAAFFLFCEFVLS